jgi:hypothetical protein
MFAAVAPRLWIGFHAARRPRPDRCWDHGYGGLRASPTSTSTAGCAGSATPSGAARWARRRPRAHHCFGGAPYGMLAPIVPRHQGWASAAERAASSTSLTRRTAQLPTSSLPPFGCARRNDVGGRRTANAVTASTSDHRLNVPRRDRQLPTPATASSPAHPAAPRYRRAGGPEGHAAARTSAGDHGDRAAIIPRRARRARLCRQVHDRSRAGAS